MTKKCTQIWHQHPQNYFPPYCFYDLAGREGTSKKTASLFNYEEAVAALQLFDRLCVEYPNVQFGGRIGVITPYKEQRNSLRRQFSFRFQKEIIQAVDINTIDGFQGQEKDIIILSCVRANPDQIIGFLSDGASFFLLSLYFIFLFQCAVSMWV